MRQFGRQVTFYLCFVGGILCAVYLVASQLMSPSQSSQMKIDEQKRQRLNHQALKELNNTLQNAKWRPSNQQQLLKSDVTKQQTVQTESDDERSMNNFRPEFGKTRNRVHSDTKIEAVEGRNTDKKPLLTESRRLNPLDARTDTCRKRRRIASPLRENIVSLIIDFQSPSGDDDADKLTNQLLLTIDSLLLGSQQEISELLIVAYGSSSLTPSLVGLVSENLKSLRLPRAELISRTAKTQIEARFVGFIQSRGSIVVFSDTQVIGTIGWLQPLVSVLSKTNSSRIVQPHFDDASQFPNYLKTAERTIVEYSWPLTISVNENVAIQLMNSERYTSHVIRGNIFAVTRNHFNSLGGYDNYLMYRADSSVASHLELSFRTWACGGAVEVVPCSRVGIRDLAARRKLSVVDGKSAERIADLWFGDRKNILLSSFAAQMQLLRSSQQTEQTENEQAEKISNPPKSFSSRTCKNIEWYFKEIVKGAHVPSKNAAYFGQLRGKSGLCAHVNDDNRIDMVDCTLAFPFELTASGLLTPGEDRCLSVQRTSYVLVEPCYNKQSESNQKLRQEWRYLAGRSQLVNPWSNFCAMHVTDPENHTVNWRQILMAQNCTASVLKNTEAFSGKAVEYTRWKFVSI